MRGSRGAVGPGCVLLSGLGPQELHHNAGGALTRTLDAFRVLLVGSRPAQVGDAAVDTKPTSKERQI
ncbi:hypothetical protein BFS79_08225 [Cutibacterium avidum]|nr:hypothetical protein BFS79_08225 [Cutibacterium avidum]